MAGSWPPHLPVAQVRLARPTDRLEEIVRFYRDRLGLPLIGSFEGHEGYDGVMIGLPGASHHLEFTRHESGSHCPAPSRDNLLVLYLPDEAAWTAAVARLREAGHEPVEPENPYWAERGATFEDPDGWRVVLMRSAGIRPAPEGE